MGTFDLAMYVLFRTGPPEPSIARSSMSSAAWVIAANDAARSEYVYIGSFPSFPDCLGNVTALEIDHEPPHDLLHAPQLFHMLQLMPRLQDLTITMQEGPIFQVPSYCVLPPVVFRLRRLVLSSVFPGWMHLLRYSRDTLECLSLGYRQWVTCASGRCRIAPSYTDTCEGWSLSEFSRLRALRFDDTPETDMLSACARLTSLTVQCDDLWVFYFAQPGTLMHLTILSLELNDGDTECLSWALVAFPVLRALRTLTVEIGAMVDDNLQIAGHPGRMVLAETCRARRIALSIMLVRRFCDWEKLDNVPQQGS